MISNSDVKLECGPMPNVMAVLPNIGGALYSTPQSLADVRLVTLSTYRRYTNNCIYLSTCRAVMLPRRETSWNLMGCPKLTKWSQPLVGRSSPYCGDIWRTYCCLTSFFPIVDMCLSCEDTARRSCAMVPRWRFLATFFASCIFSEPRAAHFRPASQIRTKATPCVQVW